MGARTSEATAHGRRQFLSRFDGEADPVAARKAHFAEMGRRSGQVRRATAQQRRDRPKPDDRAMQMVVLVVPAKLAAALLAATERVSG